MIEEAAGSPLDLRPEAGQVRADLDRTLRALSDATARDARIDVARRTASPV